MMRMPTQILIATFMGLWHNGRALLSCAVMPLVLLMIWEVSPNYAAALEWLERQVGANLAAWANGAFITSVFAAIGFCWLRRCFTPLKRNAPLAICTFLAAILVVETVKYGLFYPLDAIDTALSLEASNRQLRGAPNALIEALRVGVYWGGTGGVYTVIAMLSLWPADLALGLRGSPALAVRKTRRAIVPIACCVAAILALNAAGDALSKRAVAAALERADYSIDPHGPYFIALTAILILASWILPLMFLALLRALFAEFSSAQTSSQE
jgi:hypothetical protein